MGAVFALFAGFYYWTPKIVGRNINDFLGKIHFWTLFIGVKQIVQIWILSIDSSPQRLREQGADYPIKGLQPFMGEAKEEGATFAPFAFVYTAYLSASLKLLSKGCF